MTTENKSPSYLKDREEARRWLTSTQEGQYVRDWFREESGEQVTERVLDNDKFVDWSGIMSEHKEDLLLAANCAEARGAVELARKSSSLNAPPSSEGSRMVRFFSPPMWYVLRRQIELTDPSYWSDPKNVMQEALDHPEWAVVPADYIRGELAKYGGKPKAKVIPMPTPVVGT